MYIHSSDTNMKDLEGSRLQVSKLLIFTSSSVKAHFKWGKQQILRLLDINPLVIKTADSKDGNCSSLYSACR